MSGRKARRGNDSKNGVKLKPNAKRQLITMVIAVAIMVFCVLQVYYLARYTLGYEISADKMKVYKWVRMLVSDSNTKTDGTTGETSNK